MEAQSVTADMPNSEAVAGLPFKARRSAKTIASFFTQHFSSALQLRRQHAMNWARVHAIMSNIHYFNITSAGLQMLVKKPGQIRGVFPVMSPLYLWGMGMFSANRLGVSSVPSTGNGPDAFYRAKRAQDIMQSWIVETKMDARFDEAMQQLLYYGMTALYRYTDTFRQNAFVVPVAGCELFPIPFDARTFEEADGIMRIRLMSRQWLELQDELFQRKYKRPPPKPFASFASHHTTTPGSTFLGFNSSVDFGGKMEGAVVKWIWMKPNELRPEGEVALMIDDQLVRYKSVKDEAGPVLINNKIPMEVICHTKKPHDFWPDGFLEKLISPQLEANRQWTKIIESARFNTGLTFYDSDAIKSSDVQDATSSFIPFRGAGYSASGMRKVVEHFAPTNVGRDVGSVLGLVRELSREAVAMESQILFGGQEGRTESGPATGMLNSNARSPHQTVIERIYWALKNTYPEVLDLLQTVWPEEKKIKVEGQDGVALEYAVDRQSVPASCEVTLEPSPVMVNGSSAMLEILFKLRGMPADDGKGFEIKSREFRKSLRMLGMAPRGLDLVDEREQRILYRIGQLINDGKTPAIPDASMEAGTQVLEDHTVAAELLRNKILSPAYQMYSPQVKRALLQEMQFHLNASPAIVHPDNFDDHQDEVDRTQLENNLYAAENDDNQSAGVPMIDGVPIE